MNDKLKYIRLLAFFLFPLFTLYAHAQTSSLQIMSYNIRYFNNEPAQNRWNSRKTSVAQIMQQADIVGTQEGLYAQLTELNSLLPDYEWFGRGRTDGGTRGEFSAIFYRTDRLTLMNEGTFWLSENPDRPGSVGWDAALPRIVTWGHFTIEATGRDFYLFNTHFDHVGVTARLQSAHLVLSRIEDIAGDAPVVLSGDFNFIPGDTPYTVLTTTDQEAVFDAYFQSATPPAGPFSTFNGFGDNVIEGRRIDYIYGKNTVHFQSYEVITDRVPATGEFPSDHCPVFTRVDI